MRKTKKILDVIEQISLEHSHNTFGYLTQDDLKNEIWVICLDALEHYNKDRGPVENFLRASVKKRLINKFKNITKSVKSPCLRCPFYDPGNSPSDCSKFGHDRHLCKKWKNYQMSVESRNSLLNAMEQKFDRLTCDNASNIAMLNEVKVLIYQHIDQSMLHDFNQLLNNGTLPSRKLNRLKDAIKEIVDQHG